MTKYFVGIIAALLGALGGAWLMVAPFALAYQPEGAGWADPTRVDFWTGAGLLILSVAGFVLYILGLIEELRERGVVERRERKSRESASQEQTPNVRPTHQDYDQQPAQAGHQNGSDVDQVLLPLVTAMLQDMRDRQAEREASAQETRSNSASLPPAEHEEKRSQ